MNDQGEYIEKEIGTYRFSGKETSQQIVGL